MREVVIVEGVRTPFGKRNGRLKDFHPVVLGSKVLRELVRRTGIEPGQVEDVVFGCVGQAGEQSLNIARNAWLTAGFPVETPGTTVDRQCGSSQQAIHFAANLIQSGVADITIAGGVENMSRVPMGSNAAQGPGHPFPPELLELYEMVPQGISAELVARKYGVDRREMDEYGVRSHHRAAEATAKGYFASQILSIDVPTNGHVETMTADEGIRPTTTYEAVAALQPAFNPDHSITAANSSQITDGAAAVMLMSAERARELGIRPRARIIAQKVVGCDPVLMLEGPIPGTEADLEKTNVNGGAIAIGHPLGASGARLMNHLLYELERRDLRYGLEAMCCGGGIGTATIIDRNV